MKITGLSVVRVRVNHRGDWLFVNLETDEGAVGLGEASHGGFSPQRDQIVTTILECQCAPVLLGMDPRAVTAASRALQPLVDGLAAATAVSACEQALWDIAGKAAGIPVYRLLGGPVRTRIPLYANINRAVRERTPEGFARHATQAVAEGFRAVKCAPFDGMEQRSAQEPDQRERVRLGIACVAAVRDAVGPAVDLYVDCHSKFDVPTALAVARELAALGVRWFEEPVPTEDRDGLREVQPHVHNLGMELIGGELLYGVAGFLPYLTPHIFDLIMPDVKHCGGIAATLSIGNVADACGIAVAPHNPSGPVSMAASAHVAAALPRLRALEHAWGEVPWRHELLTPHECIEDGMYIVPDAPGLGITLADAVMGAHRA
ncbi:MAG TPA: mandelate racemase/muconate lactonizing enzyme family protein [Thermomicrobiales bacterium]